MDPKAFLLKRDAASKHESVYDTDQVPICYAMSNASIRNRKRIYAHWWHLLDLSSELFQRLLDLLAGDVPPRCGTNLFSFAIVRIGLATQQTRRAVFLRVSVNSVS